ncbi:MAG TPA: nucleotide sugar dehydrogenase, partial [Caulobacteraceae bacterium]|nr:nucleotide sugar dehydrogenase [Caulobacteraceae bacterium]
ARCDFHDPFVEVIPVTRGAPGLSHRRSQALSPEMVASYDVVLIATDHDGVDYEMIAKHGGLIVDTRNVMARHGLSSTRVAKA